MVNIKQILSRAIQLVTLRIAFDKIIDLLVAYPSLSYSADISIFVDAPMIESTTIVTKRSLSDLRTPSTIVSMVSNISSIVSNGTYNMVFKSTPIADKNSELVADSVSIYTANPPFFCVSAKVCAANNDLPDASNPVISVIRPTGNPPYGRFEIAKSSIEHPDDIHSLTLLGESSSPSKKNAVFNACPLNCLLMLSARAFAKLSFSSDLLLVFAICYSLIK